MALALMVAHALVLVGDPFVHFDLVSCSRACGCVACLTSEPGMLAGGDRLFARPKGPEPHGGCHRLRTPGTGSCGPSVRTAYWIMTKDGTLHQLVGRAPSTTRNVLGSDVSLPVTTECARISS